MLDADAKFTIAASGLVGLLAYAGARGVSTSGVLEAVGLDEGALEGPEARIPQAAYNRAWELLVAESGDADFGLHFAECLAIDAFDVVGHIAAHSATLGAAFERVVAYSRILHDAGRVELEREGSVVRVFPGCRGLPHEVPRQIAEFTAASFVVLGRHLTGGSWSARAVRFRHPPPKSSAEHTRIFGVRPAFGASEASLDLDAELLALPIRRAETRVVTYLDAYARDVLEKLPQDDDLVARVRRAAARTLERGVADVDSIATSLGMSARTLQRRLGEAETSFQAIVDGVRQDYAERYLAADRLSLTEIAFLLGFSDPSNFHRAFRRWTGKTPAAFRSARRS